MSYRGRPVRTTILYGIIAAGIYPAVELLGRLIPYRLETVVFVWLISAGYGILLSRWAKINLGRILIPYMILLVILLMTRSVAAVALASLLVLGWARSRVCFPHGWGTAVVVEFCFGFGGVMLPVLLGPVSPVGKGLGILLFFLVQAGYFVIFAGNEESVNRDPFDQARKHIESIFSPEPF